MGQIPCRRPPDARNCLTGPDILSSSEQVRVDAGFLYYFGLQLLGEYRGGILQKPVANRHRLFGESPQDIRPALFPPCAVLRHTAMSRLIASYATVGLTLPRGVFVFFSSTRPSSPRIAKSDETFLTSRLRILANS